MIAAPIEPQVFQHLKGEYALFREIVEGLGDMVFVKNLQGQYLSVNNAFCEKLQLPKEAIIGRNDHELLPSYLAVEVAGHERKLLEDGFSVSYDLAYVHPERTVYFRSRKFLMRDSNGHPNAIVGVSRDVTIEKEAQSKYRFIFDNAPIAFWEEDFSEVKRIFNRLHEEGIDDLRQHFHKCHEDLRKCVAAIRIVDVNRATMQMNRVSDKPRFIEDLQRRFTEDSPDVFVEEFVALAEGRTFFQMEAATVDAENERLDVLFNMNVLPGHEEDLSLVLVSVVDITHLKQTESELKRMRERYRSVVEGQREMICRFLPDGTLTFRNNAFLRFFDDRIPDVSKFTFHDLFPEQMRERCSSRLAELSPESSTCEMEVFNYDRSGQMVWQLWSVSAIFDRDHQAVEYQAVGSDITERKETEDALAASEARWRSVFENAEDLILTLNANGLILSANKSVADTSGMRLPGKMIHEVLSEDNGQEALAVIAQVFEKGERVDLELKLMKGPLAGRILSCVFTPMFHRERVLSATLIARDVTAGRRLEVSVREALIEGQENEQRRVSRELHDGLGQLFTAIKFNMEHLRAGLENSRSHDVTQRLTVLEQNIQLAINEVKHISHNMMPEMLDRFGLQAAFQELVKNWNSDANISLEMTDLRTDLDSHIELALFRMAQELITNAVRHSRASAIFVQLIDHDDSIMLIVEDNGSGFDPGAVRYGLGLRNIRSRAELLDGVVDIDSRPGKGTVTTVEIPVNSFLS